MIVRCGILGRKKSTRNITEITKQKGGVVTEGKSGLFPKEYWKGI